MANNKKYISIEIRRFVDREIKHLQDKINIYLKKNYRAVKEAEKVMNTRLKGMNEFRAQIKDQVGTFIPRKEYDARIQSINDKLEVIQKNIWMWMGGAIVVSIIVSAVLMIIFKK